MDLSSDEEEDFDQSATMKPTESLCAIAVRRATLSTKRAGKGYYKGTRTGSMGDHTKHGKYIIDWNKVRTYVVPKDLKEFKLTPFVSRSIKPVAGSFASDPKGPLSGNLYLSRWKAENGED